MSRLKVILGTGLRISVLVIVLCLAFGVIYLNHRMAIQSAKTLESMSQADFDAAWAQAEREVAEQERQEAARQETTNIAAQVHAFASEAVEDVERRQERVQRATANVVEFFRDQRLDKMVAAQILTRHIMRQTPPNDWREFMWFEEDLRVSVPNLGSVLSGMAPSGTLLCSAPRAHEGVGVFGHVYNGKLGEPVAYAEFNALELDPRSRISGASCTDDFWYQSVTEWLPVTVINDLGQPVNISMYVDPKHATPLYGSKQAAWNLAECARLDLNHVTANRFLQMCVRSPEFFDSSALIFLDTGIPELRNEHNQTLPWVIEDGRIIIRISEAVFVRS
jgi:hypothetical protein